MPDGLVIGEGGQRVMRLWFSHGEHYDIVYPKEYLHKLLMCQGQFRAIAMVLVGLTIFTTL